MEDLEAPRQPASFGEKAIAKVADRLLAYTAIAAHLRQGLGMEELLGAIMEEAVIPDDDKIDTDVLARKRLIAALQAISACFVEKAADRPIARTMSSNGILLSIEERAVFALPASRVTDLAGLFEAAAEALSRTSP